MCKREELKLVCEDSIRSECCWAAIEKAGAMDTGLTKWERAVNACRGGHDMLFLASAAELDGWLLMLERASLDGTVRTV